MILRSNKFAYSVIMISVIVLFQIFYEFIIKGKQGNRIFKSQLMVKCKQVDHIEINLDCERFLNFVGEEVFTRIVYEKKNKIERERVGFSKVFSFTTANQNISDQITKELTEHIDIEAKNYFLYVKNKGIESLIKEKNQMFLTYGSKEKVSAERAYALELLENKYNDDLKYYETVEIEKLYKIVITDKSSYKRNKFGRLNNINVFIISFIFSLFLIVIYGIGIDLLKNLKEDYKK